ncbi:cysteine-tryptophan domain-containing zinc finger protein 7-like isoform X3 [Dioscorea cayenensis subsp. rotundata]|uniref:Cysteine-tryptophan domain-containing zinc finger protein 7-like isoform X3 n=1 Tax=Dioscorea cayennensis subsp. rotundata TaxID=55577 RepID=A0AB40CBT5_DIOCR|nr:cysteine-tryptophan domain-containing zinc finger protein 7-like isoform X3 [Dioscorea cayenensis subsp. rotundata]
MEENELEEGEACSGHEGEALTSGKDLVNLSYIDEKLHDVLGHFQKDFEGGVSAENLGAMFGGYGSFLPMYQRSPSVWCQPRSPPNASSHNGSRSPENTLCEGARQTQLVSTCASINKTSATSVAPSFDKSCKTDFRTGAISAGETVTRHDSFNKLVNGSDQKTLKVRIKVGQESISARDNAAIYSGLGLDISPSSSLEDSPCGSEGLSTELRVAPDESPMTIIQIMTCFPVPGGYLLSPLPDNLLYLSKKEKSFLNNFKSGKLSMSIPENCAVLADLTTSSRDVKGLQKKVKILEKNGRAMDVKNSSCKDDISLILKREIDIETQDGQEIVSDALNITILSDTTGVEEKEDRLFVGESTKGSKMFDLPLDPNKLSAKGRVCSSELVKDGQRELMENTGNIGVAVSVDEITHSKGKMNLKTSITEKVLEEKNFSNDKRASSDVRNEDKSKNEKCYGTKVDFDEARWKKDFVIGSIEAPKENMVQKANLYEQDAEMMFQAGDRPSEGRGKQKKSQTNGIPSVESTKRNPKTHSSKSKEKKSSSHLRKVDYMESKSKDSKFENDHPGSFSKESHIDAEDMKTVDNRSRLQHAKDKLTEREHDYEDPLLTLSEKTKERPVVKKADNLPISEEVCAQQVAPLTLSIPGSDAVAVSNAPVLIKENWVCCDRCQKWRLLPYGANPDLLPKKWQCNMLNWLQPGMNRCNISEEETTKALNALYQMPVPQSNTSLNGVPNVAASNTILPDPHHLSHALDNNVNSAGAIGKKKHKLKDQANPVNDSASLLISSSAKKNQLASFKSRSLNDVNHPLDSNMPSKVVLEHVSKSTDFSSDKQNLKHKEKDRILGRHSDGGDYGERVGKHSKSKSKREVDQEGLTTTKRFKRDGSHHIGEDKHSEHNSVRHAVLITDDGLPTSASQHSMQKYNGFASFNEVNGDSESNLPTLTKRTKVQSHSLPNGEAREHVSVLNMEKSVSDFGKKRKTKNWQESQDHLANIDSSERPVDSKAAAKDTFSENEMKREKKLKVSKSEVDESSTSKVDGRLEKKGCTTKILLSGGVQHSTYEMEKSGLAGKDSQIEQYQVNTVSRPALDGVESLKKDLAYPQTSAAATSSSSKISGSRKSRGNLQEVRGSPVESVSSSPYRNSNLEKPFPSRRKSGGKDDAGFSVIGSPKNCSDGEADDGNDHPELRNNKDSAQRRSVEGRRSMDSRGLVSLRQTYDNEDKEAQATDGIHLKLFGDTHDDSSPTEFEETNLVNNGVNTSNHLYKCQPLDEDHTKMNNRYLANGSVQRKSVKSSSTRSRDNQSSKSSNDKGKIKVSNSYTEQGGLFSSKNEDNCQDNVHNSSDWTNYPKDLRDEHHSCQKDREDHSLKKELKAQVSSGGIKGVHTDHAVLGNLEVNGFCMSDKHHKDLSSRVAASGASCSKFGSLDNSQQVSLVDERNLFDRSEILVGRGKSQSTMSLRDKQENQTYGSQAALTSIKAVKSEGFLGDATNGDALKVVKPRKPDEQIGAQHGSLRQATPNRLEPRSPSRRDGHSYASVLKEARDLKHTANRLKSEGLELESTGLYFQAALKFLYYAFLLEPNAENARHGDGTQSMQMYSDTARLCEFCAHEYERCKQMAAASLAYKCVEVAYMKVSYLKHASVSKDRHELQAALQMVVPGESPSSSASDVDNLNNQGTLDKGTAGKGVSSPQVAGNHVVAARNRPSFVRLLNYANETVSAFDASKKMHIVFAAACSGADRNGSGCLVSVRNVLDFNFHNVERLLQLIRLAMESISCL